MSDVVSGLELQSTFQSVDHIRGLVPPDEDHYISTTHAVAQLTSPASAMNE